MNPQFAPQQSFGIPPQGYPQNRASPASGPQGFQNVPLGPPKPGEIQNGPPPSNYQQMKQPISNIGYPVGDTRQHGEHYMSNMGQMPPVSNSNPLPPPPNQFGPPLSTTKSGAPNDMKPANMLNGPPPPLLQPQFQNGSSQPPPQNGPGQLPPNIHPNQSVGFNSSMPQQTGPNPLRPPLPGQNQQLPPPGQYPTANQRVMPGQNFSGNRPLIGQPPLTGQPPMPSSMAPGSNPSLSSGSPHMSGQSQLSEPPLAQSPLLGHSSLPSQPPFPGQQMNQLGQGPPIPPVSGASSNRVASFPGQFNQPPLPGQLGGQPPLPGQVGGQPPLTNQPPLSGQPPHPGQSSIPGQPSLPSHPPMPGQIPHNQYQGLNHLNSQMQGLNLSGPRSYAGGPMKNAINGDNSPHMPPPVNQQYMNGQQMRGPPGPGYPPMPGQPPMNATGPYPQSPYQQPQQNKKLDPDQMPSPIQVTEDDKRNRSGVFCTNQKGLVPPLVTTNFVVNDQGNSSPRFIRSTMYSVPISQDIMKQTAIPFSLAISPMARTVENEYPPPIVNFGDVGPVRCIRCKAYMCPFMQFIDSGRRFQCFFCKATTDVPAEYFQHLDHTGQRMDRFERPELILGTYEFVATTDYCRNNTLPKPPAIIFIIDVSYNSVKSGLVHLLCSQMKSIIENLPGDGQEKSHMKVGFITYNSTVHFYNIKGTLAAPQMLVVGDTQEMFMPLLDGFLSTPEESGPIIEALMQQIPTMFGDTRETETILLPAILAGLEALKASECAGKLLVFHSTLPTAEAPGKLKNRDDRKLLSTDKERTVLTPQMQAYNQLGQDCVGAGCSVDLFVFNNAYIDIATISQVSRLTGGEVFKYTYFQADIDGERLINDIITDISRPTAFDAIMRVRTSTGVRPTDFYGHFYMSNTTDIELAAIDCDKAVAVEIKHDDKLSEEDGVYIQAALLYTSCSGQRRLRIMNLSLKTCSQMADLYRSCDSDTVINYIAKQSVYKLLDNNPKAVKDSIVTRTAQILATYRKNCATPSSAGQLILPECMKLLPLYVNCLLKSDALSGGSEMTIDDRSFIMQAVMTMDIITSVYHYYPRLIPLHDIDPTKENQVPSPIRCTIDKMSEQGVYILENGIHMFLWIGLGVNPEFIQKVFDVPSAIQVDIERVDLPKLDNPLSTAVRFIIDEIRYQRHRCMRLTLVRQREKMEHVFKHFLAEDRGTDGSPSYVDFLIHMHKEIRALLS